MLLGWGRINPSNNNLSPYLKQAKAPVASYSQCRRTNGRTVHESSMVCVGGRGSSVCNGDSGGPLSCMEGGKWVVRGAASWVTSRSCPGNTYSVYARVSSYVNWINGFIQGELNESLRITFKANSKFQFVSREEAYRLLVVCCSLFLQNNNCFDVSLCTAAPILMSVPSMWITLDRFHLLIPTLRNYLKMILTLYIIN